ncbi:hypothetical protein ZWY2020_019868 [Hordeum vulgare]|nr:hypothetical protein ZWY2020_019868 [Hordeum vulgare]
MTKGQTSKMEARKKKGKAAAPAQRRQRPLPTGWIQGDFLPSTVTEGDLLQLVEHGMIVQKSWRLPAENEVEPAPREGERVLLLSHVYRDRPAPPKQLALTKAEKNDIQPLVEALVDVVRRGVTGIDLLEVFLGRRIQPLQACDHTMWHYTGPEDSTRTNVLGVTEEKVTSWVLQITGPCENPKGSRRVKPFCADHPPPNQKWTNWFSPISNGNPAEEEEEGSQEGSVESADRYTPPPARQEDDPMDTDNVVSSQPGAICVDEGDQGGAEQAAKPVLEAAPPVAALAADVLPTEVLPPTEAVLVVEEPTGADLGMPQELPMMPGSSNAEFNIQRLPEEQVGAAKGAMVQVELMAGEAKRAYDSVASLYQRSLELRNDIRKTCEMGTTYETLRAERNQFASELDAAMLAMAGMKDALEGREKSLEQAREVEKMGK